MRDLLDLYCLAYDFEVRDLMWRCEEEIVLKVSPQNVVCVLINHYQRLNAHEALSNDVEEGVFSTEAANTNPLSY